MTPILYTRHDINDVLIESGERTWTDVEVFHDIRPDGQPSDGYHAIDPYSGANVPNLTFAGRFRFTFADESAAMVFSLRYGEYLVDRPALPICVWLMALEEE